MPEAVSDARIIPAAEVTEVVLKPLNKKVPGT